MSTSPSPAASPSDSPTPVPASDAKIDWASRFHYYKEWIRLNPVPLAIGALVFVALLLFLFVRGGRKRKRGGKADRDARAVPPAAAATTVKTNQKPGPADPPSASSQNRVDASSDKSVSSPATPKQTGEDPDREVFEL